MILILNKFAIIQLELNWIMAVEHLKKKLSSSFKKKLIYLFGYIHSQQKESWSKCDPGRMFETHIWEVADWSRKGKEGLI